MSQKPGKDGEENSSGTLSDNEQKEIQERTAISVKIIHGAIREEGNSELQRPSAALMWSGLAAGLSMGFSFISEGLITQYLTGLSWSRLISSFGYTIGFLIVVLGRQQLFTENTLTAVIPVLHERSIKKLLNMLRLWGIVLLANLAGIFLVSWVIAVTNIFPPDTKNAFLEIGQRAMQYGFATTLLKGIFAGWLIALMVWLLPAAETARVWIIIIITYIVGLAGFSHIIAGSAETFYLVSAGTISFAEYLIKFMIPTLIGNIIGGVSIVAALNHAQVVAGSPEG